MSDVTATAAVIAQVRAEENRKPASERLFSDPFAHLFAGDDTASAIGARYRQVPFFREQVLVRTRFIDEAIRAALARGVDQVLLLGAGFDCRALRIPEVEAAGARVFEVDFPQQLARKRDLLTQAGHHIPAWDTYVPCDLTAGGFESALRQDLQAAGYKGATQAFIVCEGVVNYLDPEDVDRTLRFVATLAARGTQLAFNYLRFRLDPASLPGRLAGLGFSAVESWSGEELYRRYYGCDPADELRGGAEEFYLSLATV